MEIREVGIEALKYAACGAAGFAAGAFWGKMVGASPLLAGTVQAVASVANRALDQLIRKLAESQDWNLSTFKIVRTLGHGLMAAATLAAFVALGILGGSGAIVFGVATGIFFGAGIGIGLYLRQSGEDASIHNFVMNDDTPFHIRSAYA